MVVGALASWGSRHVYRRASLVHAGCGHEVKLGYFCADCGGRVRGAEVVFERARRAARPPRPSPRSAARRRPAARASAG